jgi:hypothetical protein
LTKNQILKELKSKKEIEKNSPKKKKKRRKRRQKKKQNNLKSA